MDAPARISRRATLWVGHSWPPRRVRDRQNFGNQRSPRRRKDGNRRIQRGKKQTRSTSHRSWKFRIMDGYLSNCVSLLCYYLIFQIFPRGIWESHYVPPPQWSAFIKKAKKLLIYMKFGTEWFGTKIRLFCKNNFFLGSFTRVVFLMTLFLNCYWEAQKWSDQNKNLHSYA